MWWKLFALATAMIVAIASVVPIKTHVVKYDIPPADAQLPPPPRLSLYQMLESMYLTPTAVALIVIILIIGMIIAFRIVRAG